MAVLLISRRVHLVLTILLLQSMIKVGHGTANVFNLHPKYPEDSLEENQKVSLLRRDANRHGRRLLAENSAVFLLRGNVVPDGLYYVTVNFGNPPLPYFLDVDSGSDLTWVQCDAPCRSCAKGPHTLYKPKKGSLVNKKDPLCKALQATAGPTKEYKDGAHQCDYEILYADRGSSYGVLVRDFARFVVSNKTVLQTSSVFGCAYDQQGPLVKSPSPTDGILGLGSGIVSLPSQLSKQGLVKNLIGHCISDGGKDGGYMFFGDDLLPSGITWVPMRGKPSIKHYNVGVAQMNMGKNVFDKHGDGSSLGGIIFDSGSSFTYFGNQAYSSFISCVQENLQGKQLVPDSSDSTLPICWGGKTKFKAVADVAPYFKPLVLSFGSASSKKQFEIPPQGYLVISKQGNACLGILNGTSIGIGNENILGDISLQGYLVVYDNENNRIGWTRSDCQRIPNVINQKRQSNFSGPLEDSGLKVFLTNEDDADHQANMSEDSFLYSEDL